jgi:hypothetical protein
MNRRSKEISSTKVGEFQTNKPDLVMTEMIKQARRTEGENRVPIEIHKANLCGYGRWRKKTKCMHKNSGNNCEKNRGDISSSQNLKTETTASRTPLKRKKKKKTKNKTQATPLNCSPSLWSLYSSVVCLCTPDSEEMVCCLDRDGMATLWG